jgi:hypothetical protein
VQAKLKQSRCKTEANQKQSCSKVEAKLKEIKSKTEANQKQTEANQKQN